MQGEGRHWGGVFEAVLLSGFALSRATALDMHPEAVRSSGSPVVVGARVSRRTARFAYSISSIGETFNKISDAAGFRRD
jgi:hypothetical protein